MILSEHPGLQGNGDKKRELERGGENNREEADGHLEKSVRAYLFQQGRDKEGRERGNHKTLDQFKVTSQHSKQRWEINSTVLPASGGKEENNIM